MKESLSVVQEVTAHPPVPSPWSIFFAEIVVLLVSVLFITLSFSPRPK